MQSLDRQCEHVIDAIYILTCCKHSLMLNFIIAAILSCTTEQHNVWEFYHCVLLVINFSRLIEFYISGFWC